jgi:hypothetical protein
MRSNGTGWAGVAAYQAWICLLWVALVGWFAFARDERVPVLAFVNLGVHELGHLVCYLLPFVGRLVTAVAGSAMQCLVPSGLAGYFLAVRHDRIGAAACLAWAAANFQEVSEYVADAPYERLELIGGEHDWAFVLGPDQLDRMHQAGAIASSARTAGLVLLAVAAGFCIWSLWTTRPNRGPQEPSARHERYLV